MAKETTFQPHKYHDYLTEVMNSKHGIEFNPEDAMHLRLYQNLVDSSASDFEYLDSIDKYKGTSYYDTLYSNPYLVGRSNGYTPTAFESIGDAALQMASLGMSGSGVFSNAGQKRYLEELKQQSNVFYNEQLDKIRQEEYNSAPAAADRERQAGLNPDLTGGVQAGNAAENDQPLQPAKLPDQSGDILQVAAIPFNFVNGIMSLYQSYQGIQAQNLANASQEIANNNDAMNFVLGSLANSFIEANPDKEKIDLSDVSTLLDEAGKFDYSGFSRSTRRVINKFFSAFKDNVRNGKMPLGLDKRVAELRGIVTKENWYSANIQSNPLYSDDFREMVLSIYSYFGDLPNLVSQLELKASALESNYNADYYGSASGESAALAKNLESNYNADYYGSASGESAALAENSANALAKQSNEHQQSLMKTMRDIDKVFADVEQKLKDFANSGKRGSVFGLLGLLLIPTLKNQVYNGINISFPSLHINASRSNSQIIKTVNRSYNKYCN